MLMKANLGKIATAIITYYNTEIEEPLTETIEWTEGIHVEDSKLVVSYREDGHTPNMKTYDIKYVRNLDLM